jgi:hypothetical protein
MIKRICLAVCLLGFLPIGAHAAKLTVTVPPGVDKVQVLSPGTAAVLDHIRSQFKEKLKVIEEQYQVGRLDGEVKAASARVDSTDKAYKEKIDFIRKEAISKVEITIQSASIDITPQSALGEITYFYTVKNHMDKIVSNVVYKPFLAKTPLAVTSSLVLEFINPANLIFGLAPGESLTNEGHDPEHISFFINEIPGKNINQLKSNLPGSLTLSILDIHFLNQKGYKDQTKELDIKEAFSGQLKPYEAAYLQAKKDYAGKTEELKNVRKLYDNDSKGIIREFDTQLASLKKASVRGIAQVDAKKKRGTIKSIEPGKYYLYGTDSGNKAFFKEISIEDGRNKIEINSLGKDPFLP